MQVDLTPQLEDSERPREVPFFFSLYAVERFFSQGGEEDGRVHLPVSEHLRARPRLFII